MPEHSPEPWSYEDEGGNRFCVRDADGQGVFADEIGPMDGPDAPRIVACVNACAGIEDIAAWMVCAKVAISHFGEGLEEFAGQPKGTAKLPS